MKIISKEITNKSLDIAKMFMRELDLEFTEEIPESNELILYIPNAKECLFSAEFFSDLFGAYEFFSKTYTNMIIIPTNHIDFYKYIEPCMLSFAGGKFWRTNSRLCGNIFFGRAADISEILKGSSFNNGIFHGGKFTIISPLPSLIADLSEENIPVISHAMFDLGSYKDMINDIKP